VKRHRRPSPKRSRRQWHCQPKKAAKVEHETSLRVHVSLLDQLMTLAGELVLSRNQLLQSITSGDQRSSETAGQRIDLITSELQEAIMLTRMQSIGNVFNKFPRVVRDLAQSLGKQIELTLEGKEVELDKTIIESIGDPLTHLVRNSVDHGIETPDVRKTAGKNGTGQIFLRAYHEAGQVNIEITDDGKGLDGNKLAVKALEKGLITEDQVKLMSTRDKTNLIFLPGFPLPKKSLTFPAVALAWMWSKPTWINWAALSISTPSWEKGPLSASSCP
jgi:two-component system chemotaxis sensor kinase CheA